MALPNSPRRRSIFTARLINTAGVGEQPRVLDDMRQSILSGDEPPGTLIPIDAVAAFFQVSAIPVREALKVLLGEGLVEHVPRVGYSVAKLSFTEFRELYVVREALEVSALRIAVENATVADDEVVAEAHQALLLATVRSDERAYHAASRAFHRALIAPSRLHRLLHMYDSAWNMTEPARPMSRVDPVERGSFHDEHAAMVAAFVARDANALVTSARKHYAHLTAALMSFRLDGDVFKQEESDPGHLI
jgi:DNA-binding GntR family transcriptional regulator